MLVIFPLPLVAISMAAVMAAKVLLEASVAFLSLTGIISSGKYLLESLIIKFPINTIKNSMKNTVIIPTAIRVMASFI